jgi:hypothetical protein
MPLRSLSKNKLLLQKHWGVSEWVIDMWAFWMLEENISIINEIIDEEDRKSKESEENNPIPNFNPNQFNSGIDMNNIGNMMKGFNR